MAVDIPGMVYVLVCLLFLYVYVNSGSLHFIKIMDNRIL